MTVDGNYLSAHSLEGVRGETKDIYIWPPQPSPNKNMIKIAGSIIKYLHTVNIKNPSQAQATRALDLRQPIHRLDLFQNLR